MSDKETPAKGPIDWSKDYFPTSAKPVFRSMALLALIIVILCVMVYYLSEDRPEEQPAENKRKSIAESLLTDEQLEDALPDSATR